MKLFHLPKKAQSSSSYISPTAGKIISGPVNTDIILYSQGYIVTGLQDVSL